MSRPRHFSPLRRKVEIKKPKQKIVIYSEGDKTERDYFGEMKRTFNNVVLDIEFIGGAGVPLTIANKTVSASQEARRKNRHQSYTKKDEF